MAGTNDRQGIKGQIARFARENGADAFGVASVLDIEETLPGCGPTDLLKSARSVVVMAMRIPFGSALPRTSVSYIQFGYYGLEAYLNELAYRVSLFIEDQGYIATPTPAGRDILSLEILDEGSAPRVLMKGSFDLRRAAVAAGLGQVGANNNLVIPEFGSRIRLVAVMTSLELEPDPGKEWGVIPDFCHTCGLRCVKACPAKALPGDGTTDHYRCMVIRPDRVSPQKALETLKERYSGPPLILAAKCMSFTDSAPHTCATCLTLCPSDRMRRETGS